MKAEAQFESYEFTNEWFLGNVYGRGLEVDIVNVWHKLLNQFNISKILEIGSYEGQSTIHFCEYFCGHKNLEITCIDTWGGSFEHIKHDMLAVEKRFDNNIQKAKKKFSSNLKIEKLKMTSVSACAKLISDNQLSRYDLIYIDGSHKACDVLSDAVMSFPLLKKDGLMIFDDYLWNYGLLKTGSPLNIPKSGIDSFTNNFADQVSIIHGLPAYQLYLKKLV